MFPQISKGPSCSLGDLGLTPEPLCATVTSRAVHFCPDLCESSGQQLNNWGFPCNEIGHGGHLSSKVPRVGPAQLCSPLH